MAKKEVSASENINTLVVMCHGFWGGPQHLNHLRDTLLDTHPDAGIKVFVPASNRENNTYDGIEVGAERITHEILETVEQLKQDGHTLRKFSIIGYSLGGLIARYVIGLLSADGFFDVVEPVNFTTFASPHLGVRVPKLGYQNDTWNWLGSNLLSVSGQQLYLTDNFRETGRPLLDILADPASIFMKGLQRFQKRTVYSNIGNDPAVPYYSANIAKYDPYINLEAVDLHYLSIPGEDQQIILDPANPVTPKLTTEDKQQSGWLPQWGLSEQTRSKLPFYAFAATVLPIGIPIFIANAGYQTYQSAARVKAHETGDKVDLQRYRLPFLEETQRLQDAALERLQSASKEEYLSETSNEPADQKSVKQDPDHPWPTLALNSYQFSMVENLDNLGITKYACHIRFRRAHAAMIVRAQNTSFDDGKLICKHWANGFLT